METGARGGVEETWCHGVCGGDLVPWGVPSALRWRPCAEGGVCSLRKAIRTATLSASNPLVFHLLSAWFIRARTTSLDSW